MNKNCPKCNIAWEQEETIYEYFLNEYGDKEKAMETASLYGHTEEEPKHFSINVVAIEDPTKYDGVSYYKCTNCQLLVDRWTMEEVKE